MNFTRGYYENIEERLRVVLADVADLVPSSTVQFLTEMLDHNELGLALEVMVEALAESHPAVDAEVLAALSHLARTMTMTIDVVGLLKPPLPQDPGELS